MMSGRPPHRRPRLSTRRGGKFDRINGLHDDLLRIIISRLPLQDAVRTTSIGRRWRHLWHSIPLVLKDGHLPEPERAAAVSRVLADHPGPFHTVHLYHCRFDSLSPELAEWPRLLSAKAVQSLFFVNRKPSEAQAHPYPRLPADILRCASLEELFLSGWTLPDHLSGSPLAFPCLKMLNMLNMVMSDQDLDYLLAASPVLETLVLDCSIKGFHIRSQSLRSVLVLPRDFTVLEAPLLERLIFMRPESDARAYPVTVEIASTTNLQKLGYMEPMIHKLQINGSIIQPDTVACPSTVVPAVRTLALKVNFCVLEELKMVASLLRCFPNLSTLHIQSVMCDPSETATGEHHTQFWREAGPVQCLRSTVKRIVFHKFQGHQNEFEFLKFVARDNANALESLLLVSPKEKVLSEHEVNEMIDKLGCTWFTAWASEVLLLSPEVDNYWSPTKACKLTVSDPFR